MTYRVTVFLVAPMAVSPALASTDLDDLAAQLAATYISLSSDLSAVIKPQYHAEYHGPFRFQEGRCVDDCDHSIDAAMHEWAQRGEDTLLQQLYTCRGDLARAHAVASRYVCPNRVQNMCELALLKPSGIMQLASLMIELNTSALSIQISPYDLVAAIQSLQFADVARQALLRAEAIRLASAT
eukprot:1696311-Pleurochrysis_carterae.AAC.2